MKKIIFVFVISFFYTLLFSQESLLSIEENYYDFLSLSGVIDRPTLGYRTLSDSVWELSDDVEHLWKDNYLGKTKVLWEAETQKTNWFINAFFHGLKLKLFGPEWFNSYNTSAPYGQNDGALWQGRGYNTSLTGGVRLEGYGFELTFKPMLCWSENREFEYITPNYKGDIFIGKAEEFGYYGLKSIDLPQRFGSSSFFTFDFLDSEVRYNFYNLTFGFGTQNIWLGPSKINAIIHSNNSPTYPKIDFGLKKTDLIFPNIDFSFGKIEIRGWWGKLSESQYFDNDSKNNNNLISGISINYELPGIFENLIIGFNRTMMSKFYDISPYTLFHIFIPIMQGGKDESDQRMSFTFDYLLPKVNFELYFEWARNDYSPTINYILRYPFHTQGYTFGCQKSFSLKSNYKFNILIEITNLGCSQDYDRLLDWSSTFYAHHLITQGYTNRGQCIGAGIGTGGNSQYIGFTLFYPKGKYTFFAQRINPDLDYTMYIDNIKDHKYAEVNTRVKLDFGFSSLFYISSHFSLNFQYVFEDEHNPLNVCNKDALASIHRYNNSFLIDFKYNF